MPSPSSCRCCRRDLGPEGLIAIPSRNLVAANEVDLVEDGGARSHVMIYERAEGPATYPMIMADRRQGAAARLGRPLRPRGRSGQPGKLFAVSDSFYGAAHHLHDRRHQNLPSSPASLSRATAIPPRSSTSKASCRTAKAASGWPPKAIPTADSARHPPRQRQGRDRAGDRPPDRTAGGARPASASKASPSPAAGDDLIAGHGGPARMERRPKGQVKLLAYKPTDKEWSAQCATRSTSGRSRLDGPVGDHCA